MSIPGRLSSAAAVLGLVASLVACSSPEASATPVAAGVDAVVYAAGVTEQAGPRQAEATQAPYALVAAAGLPAPTPTAVPGPTGPAGQPPKVLVDTPTPTADLRQLGQDVSPAVGVYLGHVLTSTLHSEALQKDLPYSIYLPPGYEWTTDRYPVAYFLHGEGGSYAEWTEKNYIGVFADAMIGEARIRPMIMVMPDGGFNYFMNHAVDGERWGDYVVTDVVRHIDGRFRTLASPDNRAVAGNSMGGQAALQLAFNFPQVFSIVMANSPSLRTNATDNWPYFFGDWAYYADYDPIRLAAVRPGLESLSIWIDIGDQDQWLEGAQMVQQALVKRGLNLTYQLYSGGHHWSTYWIEHTPEYLTRLSRDYPPAAATGVSAAATAVAAAGRQPAVAPVTKPAASAQSRDAELHRAVVVMVRGLRVYAALTDSRHMQSQALTSLQGFKSAVSASGSSTLAKTMNPYTPAIEQAISKRDVENMRLLADELERKNE